MKLKISKFGIAWELTILYGFLTNTPISNFHVNESNINRLYIFEIKNK